MKRALRFGFLGFLVAGCAVRVGTNQPGQAPGQPPPGQQQPIPPPQAYQQNAPYVYYPPGQQAPPQVRPPLMPPALSIREPMNFQHLQRMASAPRACNIPLEVSPGNFVRLDCIPYTRISIATMHATPAKLKMMSSGGFNWNGLVGALGGLPLPGQPAPVRNNTGTYPDMVDHRLNGTVGPIKDQGSVGACTSFALSSVFDNSMRRASQNVTTSPQHMWSRYGYPTMEDAAKSNLNQPTTTHEVLPYSGKEACMIMRDTTDDCGATYGVRPNSASGDAALQAKLAKANSTGGPKITAFEELTSPPNIDEIIAVLASGADIWAAVRIDSSSFVNRRMNNFVIPDWMIPDGGHAMAMSGYRKVNGQYQFLMHNSWGVSWGDQGYAWVSQAMIQRWMVSAYKVKTDVDAGGNTPVLPKTDEDCRGDQVIDTVTKLCAGICPDGAHPANGQCSGGPAPGPQPLNLPGGLVLPGGLTIPGWGPQPQPQPQPNPPNQPNQPVQPTQPTQPWPWPMPSNIPTWPPPPTK